MSPTASSTSTPPASDPATSSGGATDPTDPLANESTFLTLLVSQLQNQDPLDPVDSNQFVSQLTSYSQLEQLIGIHQNTTTLSNDAAAATGSTGTANSTTGA
jgi:flagellar basal-body rod modification protein FlgD